MVETQLVGIVVVWAWSEALGRAVPTQAVLLRNAAWTCGSGGSGRWSYDDIHHFGGEICNSILILLQAANYKASN